jgi:hypothetical protein
MGITYGTTIGSNVATITDPYINKMLRGWMPEGLIVPELLPAIPSDTYKGRIPKQNTAGQLKSSFTLTPAGFPTITLDYDTSDSYKLAYRGLTASPDYATIEEMGGESSAIMKITALLNANVAIGREFQTAANMTSTTTMTQNFNPDVQWNNYAADILADWTKAISVVRTGIGAYSGCGFTPNVAVIPWEVYNVLRRHPQIVKSWLGTVSAGKDFILDEKMLASIL